MGGRLESPTALLRTPEGSPVGPTIRCLRVSIAMLLAIVAMGLVGYRVIEDFSFFDALYQTTLTLTTIGFQELQPLSDGARALTIVLAALGVGAVFYLLATVARLILEGELKRDVEAWRMGHRIADLRNHFVVCGAGRVGAELARAMVQRNEPFLMIDSGDEALVLLADDWLTLPGDVSNNEILEMAGIAHARGAIVATRSDAENTFIILTVLAMNPSC